MRLFVGLASTIVAIAAQGALADVTGLLWQPVDAPPPAAAAFDLYALVSSADTSLLLVDAGDPSLTDPLSGLPNRGIFISGSGSIIQNQNPPVTYFALGPMGPGDVGILRSMTLHAASWGAVVDGAWFDPPGGQSAQPLNEQVLLGRFAVTSTQTVLGGVVIASGQPLTSSLFISWTTGGEFRTGVFEIPSSRPCLADFDGNGSVAVPDIFAFLAAWFAADPRANIDGINGVAVPDIFAFLSLWFAGCP